jgi:hypothetical protein
MGRVFQICSRYHRIPEGIILLDYQVSVVLIPQVTDIRKKNEERVLFVV